MIGYKYVMAGKTWSTGNWRTCLKRGEKIVRYDVFNGDADGICALHQLRLEEPKPDAELVTGVKRDIRLLDRLVEKVGGGDEITVLDVSMDSNKDSLKRILSFGCRVFYVDHHFSGEIPESSFLSAQIDPNPDVCTSLIVDRLLAGRYRAWAVAAAFGDNLHDAARKSAQSLSLGEEQISVLRELGELMNYNGYGASIDDLHLAPQELYKAVRPFDDPLAFYNESPVLARLRTGYASDMENAGQQNVQHVGAIGRIFYFPAEPWSKRVAGVYSNEKAREKPEMAHALLVDNGNGTYMASVRAPLQRKKGADDLCRKFPTGGGRAAAAGINALPEEMLDDFLGSFREVFST